MQKKPSLSLLVHQKKLRLHKLQQRLEQLVKDREQSKISLCFGSKKLFHAQFNLEENNYKTREEWLESWKATRTSEIFFLGSKFVLNTTKKAGAFLSCSAEQKIEQTVLQINIALLLKNKKQFSVLSLKNKLLPTQKGFSGYYRIPQRKRE